MNRPDHRLPPRRDECFHDVGMLRYLNANPGIGTLVAVAALLVAIIAVLVTLWLGLR